jgi:hypothetical protein
MTDKELASYLRSEILTKMRMLKELDPEATVRIIDTNIMPAEYDFSDIPISNLVSISFTWDY